MGTSLRINRLHWPVTTLGYGKRIGIWFQGCSIHCPACCSRDTWDKKAGSDITLEALLEWVNRNPLAEIDGFTISGGEPFDQAEALTTLLKRLRQDYCGDGRRDILIYSGYPLRQLTRQHRPVLDHADALVSEPYLAERPSAPLRGSDNQCLSLLTTLGKARYGSDELLYDHRLQSHFDGKTLWMIGIPAPGDLAKLQRRLADRGIKMSETSWLA